MKVAVVTPMSPQSAAADVTLRVLPALTRHWDVDVWCPAEPVLRPAPVRVTPFDAPTHGVAGRLAAYDLVVHVLDDGSSSVRILPLAARVPGLVVLHRAPPDARVPLDVDDPADVAALRGSLGAVVHSDRHASLVAGLTLGEVTVAALPEPTGDGEPDDEQYAATLVAAGERAILAVPFGHVLTDVAARLRALGLDGEPAVLDAVTELALDLFGPS